MKKNLFFIVAAFLFWSCNNASSTSTTDNGEAKHGNFTVAFYNVENLYDITDDPEISDEEFTPNGENKWTQERYEKKLADLAKVLSSIDKENLPGLIGLCEVENKAVVEALIQQNDLKAGNYQIIHENSPDGRGIDVALIYRSEFFVYETHKSIPLTFTENNEMKVRDILHVTGKTVNGEVLHVFVNHWKSRSGGQAETESYRLQTAQILYDVVAEIQKNTPEAKIIIMGDLNDEPADKSVAQVLKAGSNCETTQNAGLFNLMYNLDSKGEGTHSFRNEWNMLDNLIVSCNLVDATNGLSVKYDAGSIFKEDWILYKNEENGSVSPNRTYGGKNYYGGYSDHLPVFAKFTF